MHTEKLKYAIALTKIKGVGDILAKNLIAHAGGFKEVFNLTKYQLEKIPGIGTILARDIFNQLTNKDIIAFAKKEIEFIEKENITPLFYKEKGYPINLAQCEDAPLLLYTKGNLNFNTSKILSIVGTRKITEYGKSVCEKIIKNLPKDVLVVSGLAYGVDSFAHKKCVEYGIQTACVLAHGLDRIYPATNKQLASNMLENGGLISDFTSNTNPDRENFPKRNRIIAGIADATLVVESAKKGGSLITAEIANSYSRDVFAVPGRVTDTYSEGCNYLIKTNKAHLVNSADDICYIMNWNEEKPKVTQKKLFIPANPQEDEIYSIFTENELTSIDTITNNVSFSSSQVAVCLLELEMKGYIKSLPGKMYKWI